MLQDRETLSDTGAIAASDTVRWVIGEASSGAGPTRRTHILVKPTDPGLKTNLVINTDRRTYHVEIRSTAATYMASVGWSYPQDELIAVKARVEAASQVAATQVPIGIDPAKLDFAYRLSGDTPPWRPVQVFDDGDKTYLLFPDTIARSELRPLFLIGDRTRPSWSTTVCPAATSSSTGCSLSPNCGSAPPSNRSSGLSGRADRSGARDRI